MGIRSWLRNNFGTSPAEPNFVVMTPDPEDVARELESLPLTKEIKEARLGLTQSAMALGRANARARQVLAAQTLINVQGRQGYAPHH